MHMRLYLKLALALGSLLIVVVLGLRVFGPVVNAPWRGMLQQMSLLPAWLERAPITGAQVTNQLSVPLGYSVSLFAADVSDARMLRVTTQGDVLVAMPRDGKIMLLSVDADGDGMSDGRRLLLDNLTRPNGIDIWEEYLYVAEEDGVGRVLFDAQSGTIEGAYERIIDGLPRGGNHWKKTIRFGPDGALYVAIGSSCNVCVEDDARRGTLLRYTRDGLFLGVFADGLRNSAGFDWAPDTGVLYATDNGRDMLGDDFPPCELNAIVEGGFYGWPYVNGNNIFDPDLGNERSAVSLSAIPPVHEFKPHNAPLGITFLRRSPEVFGGQTVALVALHGSWNRSRKDGYKVVSLHFDEDGMIEEQDFLTGFLVDDTALGRPAEIAEAPDGTIYVSDDLRNAIYRIGRGSPGVAVSLPVMRASLGYESDAISQEERDAALASGPPVFERENCLTCHALTEDTESSAGVLQDLRSRYTVDELTEFLSNPRSPMPAYAGDADQRRSLSIYLLETY